MTQTSKRDFALSTSSASVSRHHCAVSTYSAASSSPSAVMAGLSIAAFPLGLIAWQVWYDEGYCQRHPDSGPNMRVSRSCVEILAESSPWQAAVSNIGFYVMLASVGGLLLAGYWWVKANL